MKMRSIIYSFLAIILFTGCEKVIDLDINANQSKIIIDGIISNEVGPYFIRVSKTNGLKSIEKNPSVNDAIVTISDGLGTTEVLQLAGEGIYKTKTIVGKPGVTYTLTVKVGSETYTSRSKMPEYVPLNDINLVEVTFGGDIDYYFVPIFTDPVSKGDYYRFLLSVNDTLRKSDLVISDLIENGTVNKQQLQDTYEIELEPGDIVKMVMQHVDEKVGLYYNTLALIKDDGIGGGITPSNPPNNISGGALGIFSAHTTDFKTVIVK
jgi:hypothetical protein